MKKSTKIFIFLFFFSINILALFIISKIFTVNMGILASLFVLVLACIDLVPRLHNIKILKQQKKYEDNMKNNKIAQQNEQKRRKEEAINKNKRKQQMREHNSYRSNGK